MLSDAARILQVAGKRGKNMAGYQGLRLGTILSVAPFKMAIDDIDCEFLADDVLVNAQMLEFIHTGEVISKQSTLNGTMDLSGSGTIDGNSRGISIDNADVGIKGQSSLIQATITLKSIFKNGDRVAVAAVGMNKFLILCKVVSWS